GQEAPQREQDGCREGGYPRGEGVEYVGAGDLVVACDAQRKVDASRELAGARGEQVREDDSILLRDGRLHLAVIASKRRRSGPVFRFAADDRERRGRAGIARRVFARVQELAAPDPVRSVPQHVLGELVFRDAVEQSEERATQRPAELRHLETIDL